jgi:predicted 2-oxoglutarate/Fe(II)-dependent dioxygenase YbiX
MPSAAWRNLSDQSLRDIEMPDAIKRLPVSDTGFPVPWFTQWFLNGKPSVPGVGVPDLRITDFNKRHHSDGTQCWICGEPLGEHKAFLISEDVVKTRVHDEPPSHRDCAIFAAKACPFIVNPQMRRNRKDMPLAVDARSGHPAKYCVWVTNKFAIENRGGRRFWRFGEAEEVLWFSKGKQVAPPPPLAMKRVPALLMENVFDAALCEELIAGFESDGGATGYAGTDANMVIDHEIKERRDWVVTDQAMRTRLTALSGEMILKPLFNATWFRTQKAEKFIVARYDVGGHFTPHVDVTPQTAHRRFAVSLGLNDDYEGGELLFPDFGESFRIGQGDAVVFSCGLMHGVTPVTRGTRYVFLTFLF